MTTTNTTLDQQRAAHALAKIRDIQGRNDGMYVSYISAMPATIVMNGLGQALITQRQRKATPKTPID
jgi:CRISPR-associated protein Cmr5